MPALHWLSAVDLVRGYRTKSLSPVDVTRALLDRIAKYDEGINAFCLIDRSAALGAAGRSEQRWLRGEPLGRLDGVPVAIKDLLLTQGWPGRSQGPAGGGNRDCDRAGPRPLPCRAGSATPLDRLGAPLGPEAEGVPAGDVGLTRAMTRC
jgi:aspartyl-tRNA(Asn)/glutamyl-tRNA(Gln) amidotransferase subunit A